MKITNVHINWHKGEDISPELIITIKGDLPADSDELWNWEEKFYPDSNATIYYGQRPDGLVRFYWGATSSDSGIHYTTRINVNGEEVELINPPPTSCPVINWFELGPCIDASFTNEDGERVAADYYTHITINKCIDLLGNYVPNVRLVRKNQGDVEEIEYLLEKETEELNEDEIVLYPKKGSDE